ncbi:MULTISPECIES: GDYXXLXY domain-containing protein [unclassified Bacillus (in: firmicutes)]|uniref:GDYXXLXY domain-containing protein n=1 Tax=unclassified Bacillus (in: firmicutes) TaxID=185979 RepID=UPI0008E536A9|nr:MULTISPECIES: GDYXXLXY domain-containing protein [unclassified Bacillus (in: firmicutes)]SFB07160.1 Uncharacterized membrane-anchored protein [Bacillus sp. UNCCL13]SFQ87444.1 Uncharacterized membrane-anchored protein [Bacillus sp. cl95]
MNKRTKQLLLACALPVLILLGMTVKPIYTVLKGEEIKLQTKPVDPSDVFRGDYVALGYEAEEITKNLVDADVIKELNKRNTGVRVYVSLVEKEGIHVPEQVSLREPKSGIYLKGTLQYIGPNNLEKEVAYIEYSLDKYFIEDNTGTELEKAAARGDMLAMVKVKNGYAILTDLTVK